MAFKKLDVNSGAVYVDFGEEAIKIVSPNAGAVSITSDSFETLLKYFKSYDFMLAKKEDGVKYYGKNKKPLGYFVENSDGDLIIVDIVPNKAGKYGDVTFSTISSEDGQAKSSFSLLNPAITKVVVAAAAEGIECDAPDYTDILFVDALPAETSAKRFTVYATGGKFYTLNADEDAFVELTLVEKKVLPSASTMAQENVLYNLSADQTVDTTTFKAGVYTYAASGNKFTLQDLKIEKVAALPALDKADATTIYVLTKKEVVDENTSREKGTAWKVNNNAWAQETRQIKNVASLPYVELAVANTYYLVDGEVTLFKSNKFTKVGRLVKVNELPDITTIKLDATVIYVLTKQDGERAAGTKWVFDMENKEFVAYVDSLEDEVSPAGGEGTSN